MKTHLTAVIASAALLCLTSLLAHAEDYKYAQVMEVTSDARQGEQFRFGAALDAQGDLLGLVYYRVGQPPKFYPMDEVRSGAVLKHDDGHNIDVVTLYGPALDAKEGGKLRLHFLLNGITKSYRDFSMEIVRNGAKWSLYTPRDQGFTPFTHMFMKANRVMVIGVIGINHIETY
jgi:hypothetical protein